MMDASSLDDARKLFDEKPSHYFMKYHGTVELEIHPFRYNRIPVIVFQSKYMIPTAPQIPK